MSKKKYKGPLPKPKPKRGDINESKSKSPYIVKDNKMIIDPDYKSIGGMVYKGR